LAEVLYLVDVNLLIARLFEAHEHHDLAAEWFQTSGLQWALCPWVEAGFLRFATKPERLTMTEATGLLDEMALHPGYRYHTCAANWRALTKPFFRRLHGHKQVTDAYLLGMAIADDLIFATFDKRIIHLAGEHAKQVLTLGA
jgi:toxin-antitoxin system PIN domain toxin